MKPGIPAAFIVAALAAAGAPAQPFPGKPVRIVIPFPVGGSSDANARIIGPHLSERWKQPVIVDPRPGAATVVGSDHVAKSAPDGHTLMINSTQFVQSPATFAKLPYDPYHDIVPITRITVSPQAIVAHPSLPVRTIRELVALAKARPGELNMGTAGTVLPSHYFFMLAKVKMEIVPYKGAGPLMVDASGGHVPIAIGAVSSVQAAVRAGRVRMLGVTSHSPAFPDAPVIDRDVPGFDADTWFAMFAPRATPPELVRRIHDDIVAVLQIPEVRRRLLDIGGNPSGEPVEEFQARVKSEIAKWLKVAKAAGLKPQ
ncbi:MAG: tripartite tricarboxylate transporter substrate binding protein [Burkholderiales bacterium]|nr:tripartite tricarboxylate transporter substrate binding protein [Burkholderiales bacterium]